MKRILSLLFLIPLLPAFSSAQTTPTRWHWQEGTIVVETPVREASQQSAVGLKADPLPVVRVAFVGLGMRGPDAVVRFSHIPGVEIVALCDYYENLAERSQEILRRYHMPPAALYSGEEGYKELCARDDVDLVYIATDWDHHFPVARCAMEHGKHVAIEVPSAMNLSECWQLIDLCEKTRRHCMMLENCCYDYFEMNALAMAQAGVFGEIIRAEGAYIHDLTPYWDQYWKNPDGSDPSQLGWRLKYNSQVRGDIYPTHGLGPVAQCLDILRGDIFTTLVAMDTRSVHGLELMEARTGRPTKDFRNGDHTTTLLRTARGKVVEIQHNVMTPQPYNRLFKLTGSRGYASKYPSEHFALNATDVARWGVECPKEVSAHGFLPADVQNAFVHRFYHPILTRYGELGRDMGHGGMDFIMDSRLVYCLRNGLPLDIDVYDLAEWCCLAELGQLSMDHNCASVAVPDFTRGEWQVRQGFRHAYAPEADDQAREQAAEAFSARQREMVEKCSLWSLYDAQKSHKPKDVRAYQKAVERFRKLMR